MQKQEQAAQGMGRAGLLMISSSDTLGTKEPWKCLLFKAQESFILVRGRKAK